MHMLHKGRYDTNNGQLKQKQTIKTVQDCQDGYNCQDSYDCPDN